MGGNVTSSGKEVPKATIVIPIINLLIPKNKAMPVAPLIKRWVPKPNKNLDLKKY